MGILHGRMRRLQSPTAGKAMGYDRVILQARLGSMFFLTAAALPHLKEAGRAAIINTTSVTVYRGSPKLLDYAATKGAIVSFTRSLAGRLEDDRNRVNGVAPGPIWIING